MQLSIVIPVYKSEEILPELIRQIQGELTNSIHDFEVILVNDCSPDGSGKVIQQLSSQYAFVRGLDLAVNAGQHNAIMAGLNYASGEVVVMMDDDLQHNPKYILPLYHEILSGFDICYTKFGKQKHPLWKKLGSKFNNMVSSSLLNKPRDLYLSSFKAISRFVRDHVVTYDGPYAYIDGLILNYTKNYQVIEAEHGARYQGEGGYSLRSSISLWLKMSTSFSIVPLRFASLLGFGLAGLGFCYALYVAVQALFYEAQVAGWASIIVLILLIGGLQLAMLGIVGEYIGRAYLKLNKKPQFVVRYKYNITDKTSIED